MRCRGHCCWELGRSVVIALMLWPSVRDALHQLREALAPGDFNPALAQNAFVFTMADATAAKVIPGLVDVLASEAPGVTLRVIQRVPSLK